MSVGAFLGGRGEGGKGIGKLPVSHAFSGGGGRGWGRCLSHIPRIEPFALLL